MEDKGHDISQTSHVQIMSSRCLIAHGIIIFYLYLAATGRSLHTYTCKEQLLDVPALAKLL
eukprot:scaffold351385_cov42-Prasinocladus_malaysianus.AAC.1